jgi:hypothetical protein
LGNVISILGKMISRNGQVIGKHDFKESLGKMISRNGQVMFKVLRRRN